MRHYTCYHHKCQFCQTYISELLYQVRHKISKLYNSGISGEQVFYLIDEAEQAGKGANSVISMVDHYLKKYGLGEKTAHFHFDNCTGQNKNSFVIWYALWRILSGKLNLSTNQSCKNGSICYISRAQGLKQNYIMHNLKHIHK